MRARALRIIGVALCATALLLFDAFLIGAATPAIYWHPAGDSLPMDIQAFVAASRPPGTPSLPPTLYAGTWGQGIYRSSDHGETWQSANTGITLPLHIQGGLAVNPVTPSAQPPSGTTLYAGDYYGGGLYRSGNAGDLWTHILPDAAIQAVAVHPLTPTIVLAGDREQGLYRSTDAGDTWTVISGTAGLMDPHIRTLAFAPSAPNTVYAGASQTIYHSTDAGQTWAARGTLSSTVQSLAVHPVTASLLYAGTFNHGLHRSTDWGTTWTPLGNGLPPGVWVTSLAINPVSPTVLYVGTWEGQVYRSTDGGDSWEGLGYLGYVYDVLIHPTAPSVIYAATSNNGVFRGSSLDYLTMEPVDSPQYVNQSFPITVTAHDELGFPLTGTSRVQLAALAETDAALAETLAASGFEGTAVLTDATSTISPTLIAFNDGLAVAEVTVATSALSDTITATVASGPGSTIVLPSAPSVASNPFDVIARPGEFTVCLPIVMRTD